MSHAVWRHGSSGTPSLAAGSPASENSRWSELPLPRVGHPAHGAAARADDAALDARPVRARAQVERAAAPDLVEREHEAQVLAAPLHARDRGERAEVVGLPGVRALLRAGGDQPDVAGGAREPRRERDERADAGRVVVRPGRGRDGVDVRDEHDQAVARARRGCRRRCASGRARGRGSGRARCAARPPGTGAPPARGRGAPPRSPPGAARPARARARSGTRAARLRRRRGALPPKAPLRGAASRGHRAASSAAITP